MVAGGEGNRHNVPSKNKYEAIIFLCFSAILFQVIGALNLILKKCENGKKCLELKG